MADGLELVAAGFDLLDVGAVAARSGPAVAPEEEAARLIPAIERLAAESRAAGPRRHVLGGRGGSGPRRGRRRRQRHLRRRAIRRCSSWSADAGLRLRPHAHRGTRRAWIARRPPDADVIEHLRRGSRSGSTRRSAPASPRSRSRSTRASTSTSPPTTTSRSCATSAELRELGRPLFVALSRKDFLGALLAGSWEERAEAEQREWATAAAAALAVSQGAEMLRLHDRSALDSMRVAAAITHGAAAGRPAAGARG